MLALSRHAFLPLYILNILFTPLMTPRCSSDMKPRLRWISASQNYVQLTNLKPDQLYARKNSQDFAASLPSKKAKNFLH